MKSPPSEESDLHDVSAMPATEAQRRYDAMRRWALCKASIEPVLQDAANDPSAKELLPNHQFLIASAAKNQEIVKSRKTAHSFGIALFSYVNAVSKPRSTSIIGSYDEDESKEKNNFLEWIARAVHKDIASEAGMSDGQEMRRFNNGSRIRFIARKPPTGAGASILLDEFSVEPPGSASATAMLIAALGATTHTGTVRLGGTQRGPDTLFNKIAKGSIYDQFKDTPLAGHLKNVQWQVMEFPWWSSPALCSNVKEAMLKAPAMATEDRVIIYGNERLQEQYLIYLSTEELGLDVFQREFECKILDDKESYYPYELIQSCYPKIEYWFDHCAIDGARWDKEHLTDTRGVLTEAKRKIMKLRQQYDMGRMGGQWGWTMDVGRFNDQDEIWLGHTMREAKDVLCYRLNIGAHLLPFPGKRELVDYMLNALPFVRRGFIDATHGGHGTDLYEWARQKFKGRVSEFTFDNESKRSIATSLRIRMENSKVFLPPPQKYTKLENQLLRVKKIMTGSGNVVFDTERNKNFHGDCFWSAAMMSELFGHPMKWVGQRSAVAQQMQSRAQQLGVAAGRHWENR